MKKINQLVKSQLIHGKTGIQTLVDLPQNPPAANSFPIYGEISL